MTYPNNSNVYLPGVIAIPSTLQITDISQSNPMVLTTTYDPITSANTYLPGMQVKLIIPVSFNMWQANGIIAQITEINGSLITLNVDSTMFDAFIIPEITSEQPASMATYGSRNLQYNNFTNQVPFQSLNDIEN